MSALQTGFLLLSVLATLLVTPAAANGAHDHGQQGFGSPMLGRGEAWNHTFVAPGEYRYHCHPHPHMKGAVLVHLNAHQANKTVRVLIRNYQFVPAEVNLPLGATVEWVNEDADVHTATQDAAHATTSAPSSTPLPWWMLAAAFLLALRRRA